MPGVAGELGEERPLGAAVARAERVQRVDVGEDPARAVRNGSRARPRSRSAAASRPDTSAAQDTRCCGRQDTDPNESMDAVRSCPARP
jgi:hypothetical protein